MTQLFQEFLRKNKFLFLPSGEKLYCLDGKYISIKDLGEWALNVFKEQLKESGKLKEHWHDRRCWYRGKSNLAFEIYEGCLGNEETEKRLKGLE